MATVLDSNVLDDDLAMSLARVVAAANRRAHELGIDATQSQITITQIVAGVPRWRINYGPRDYLAQRGGDLIVEADASDASITRVLRGQ